MLSSYLYFAGEIGAKEVIIHPVLNPVFISKPDDFALPLRMRDSARRSLDELIPVAQKAKVRILLENLSYLCNYPLLTMKELRQFVELYPPESVGLVIDTGHAKMRQDDPAQEIRIAGERLYGTHLHDTDEKGTDDYHWVPTHGAINWGSILNALAEVKYAGTLNFEIANGRFGESPEELARICYKMGVDWITAFEKGPGCRELPKNKKGD